VGDLLLLGVSTHTSHLATGDYFCVSCVRTVVTALQYAVGGTNNSWLHYTTGSVCSDISLLHPPLPCITQGAWYVLSALGLYATTPGTTEYVLGSPVFRHVRIARSAEPYEPYYERSYEQVASAGTDAGRVVVLVR
jgi:hypothetical protein